MFSSYGIKYKGVAMSVPELIGAFVNNIRDTYSIDTVTKTGNIYVFTTKKTFSLANGDYVKIDSVENLLVSNVVKNTSFSITSTDNLTASTTWQRNKPYFLYGHPVEIATILSEKTQSGTYKYQKFPLVAFFLNNPEQHIGEEYIETEIFLALINSTNVKYKAADRATNNFKNILRPLLNDLMDEFEKNKFLFVMNGEHFEPEITDVYFYGSDTGQNILNEQCDAIELKLPLKIKKQKLLNC
jgi:hypothetical protein